MIATILILYFVPTLIAGIRQHRSGWAILVLNLCFGWTLLGWLWAFIWSLTGNTARNHSVP